MKKGPETMVDPSWMGLVGNFRFFDRKKRDVRNQCKLLSIKAKDGPGRALKNVLTVKVSHF